MGREEVLAAVRTALGRAETVPPPAWTPPARPAIADLAARFIVEAQAVQAEVRDARGTNWTKVLQQVIDETGANGLFLGPGLDVEDLEVPAVDAAAAEADPAHVMGVVRADAAIAATGTLVIDEDGAHLPNLVAETAVVVLSASTLVPYLSNLASPGPSVRQRVLVTGPSRTSDIEKILVLGAHGPRRLVVVLVD